MYPKSVLVAVTAAVLMAFSSLGWCPPPPDLGVFLPNGQTYDLGDVPIGTSRTFALTFLVAPSSASMSPFVVSSFAVFIAIGTAQFSIDPIGTTCIPGALVTPTSGCIVKVTFVPSAISGQQVVRIGIAATPASMPMSVSTVAIDDFTARAVPALPVPVLSGLALFLLAVVVAGMATLVLPMRIHRTGRSG